MSFWTSLISPVTNLISSYIDKKKEKEQAKHKRELAIINNQARLAASAAEYNHTWEMENLRDKDKFLRKMSFFLFTAPIVIAVVYPEYAKEMFDNLKLVPEWLLQIWFYMIAGVWGIASLKNNVTEIISNLRKDKKNKD